MKILHIIPSLRKGGAERLAVDICNELNSKENFEAKILLLHEENDYATALRNTEVVHSKSFLHYHISGKSESDFEDYKKFVTAFSPSIIHSHLFEAEFFSREILFPGVSYFSHLHDNMIQFEGLSFDTLFKKEKLTNYLEKHHLIKKYRACNNHFIANSKHTESFFRKNLPSDLCRSLIYIPNAIDLKQFPFTQRSFPENELRLITTGSLVKKKNHSLLLQVIKSLSEQGMKAHLTILGDGPLMFSLQKESLKLDIKAQVSFAGNVNDVAAHLNHSHVYVHSATYEPYGLAIVEAMATGLPVVGIDGGGNRELIVDGINGFLLTKQDAQAFSGKIREVVKDNQTYQQFGEQARKSAEQLDIGSYVTKMVALYEKAM